MNEAIIKRVKRAKYKLPEQDEKCLIDGQLFGTCPHSVRDQQIAVDAVRAQELLK